MTSVDPLSTARRTAGCRLRPKPGGKSFLIYFAEGFELDPLSAAIWRRLDGRSTVLEVVADVAESSGIAYAEVAQSTLACVRLLASKGFVELTGADDAWPAVRNQLASGLWPKLLTFSTEATLLAPLETDRRARVVERFVQICWEMAANCDAVYAREEDYWRFVGGSPTQALRLHLQRELEFRDWNFRAQRNQITLLFRGSTYTGDIDNRV
ncbi:MAG TPA: PqqD family protein [Polyangiaceae bacterium]|nr:PqqD family protein [Polyangiaceae bacterium]